MRGSAAAADLNVGKVISGGESKGMGKNVVPNPHVKQPPFQSLGAVDAAMNLQVNYMGGFCRTTHGLFIRSAKSGASC